ncbi:MAG TPA: hypothetical protein VIA63_09495 [Candidatus Limnocylindria bacterium]|jgi:hypothetical protein
MDDYDLRLQRIFDERLLRVLPPPRDRRAQKRIAGAVGVLLTAALLLVAADVNRTADAAGLSCTDLLAKVEIWFESVKNGSDEQRIEFKTRVAKLVGQTCDRDGSKKTTDANKPVLPASEPMKPSTVLTPACAAAHEQVKQMVASVGAMTRAEELALKQRADALLAGPCDGTK